MALAFLVTIFATGCLSKSEGKTAPARVDHGTPAKSLPMALISILPTVKAKSRVPILLPSELPDPIRKAKFALVEKAATSGYTISLYYELGIGDAGFAAFFSAQTKPAYNPEGLRTQKVKLSDGIQAFFRPVSCGGSCTPANLWWKQGDVLYQIQLKLPATATVPVQEKTMAGVANSAILAGPR